MNAEVQGHKCKYCKQFSNISNIVENNNNFTLWVQGETPNLADLSLTSIQNITHKDTKDSTPPLKPIKNRDHIVYSKILHFLMLNRPRTKLQVHYSTIGRYYHQPINPPKENHKHEKKNSMITHLNKGKKITSYIENELQTPEDALLHPHKKSPL